MLKLDRIIKEIVIILLVVVLIGGVVGFIRKLFPH